MATGPTINKGKSKQDYETPDSFMLAVADRFGIPNWDLAASDSNSKAIYWFTQEKDSLSKDWSGLNGTLWLNPPFSKIEPWAKKCSESMTPNNRILLLVPASVGSEWYRKWVEPYAYVLALNPRLTFKGCTTPYPKDLILAVYGQQLTGFKTWRWKP